MDLPTSIHDLHWLAWQMRKYEDKYRLRSSDFYAAMESGQLATPDQTVRSRRLTAYLEPGGPGYRISSTRRQRHPVANSHGHSDGGRPSPRPRRVLRQLGLDSLRLERLGMFCLKRLRTVEMIDFTTGEQQRCLV